MFMQWYCGGMASVAIIRRSDKAGLFIEKDLTLWEATDGKHEKN